MCKYLCVLNIKDVLRISTTNLSTPENVQDIKLKWNKRVLSYCIANLTPKLTEESINRQIDAAFKVWKKKLCTKI